jgi:mevalonate kinase
LKSSAPGKVILFGEHAVVYSRPALAVPVTQVHVDVEVLDSSQHGIWIHAPGIDLHDELGSLPDDHPVGSVIRKVLSPPFSSTHFLNEKMEGQEGMDISIESTIPVAAGLGSGAAVSVALIRALSEYFNQPLTDEEVNNLAYEVENFITARPPELTTPSLPMPGQYISSKASPSKRSTWGNRSRSSLVTPEYPPQQRNLSVMCAAYGCAPRASSRISSTTSRKSH